MAKLIYLIFTLQLCVQAFAYDVASKITIDEKGAVQKYLQLTCSSKENLCKKLCKNSTECKIPEVLCQECATQKSQLLYSVFTDVNSVFQADVEFISEEQFVGFLKNRKFISIPHDLFLNMFTPENKEVIKLEFERLCVTDVSKAILLATVNSKNEADELVGVMCKDDYGTLVLPMHFNLNYSNKKSEFWNKLNAEIGYRVTEIVHKTPIKKVPIEQKQVVSLKDTTQKVPIAKQKPKKPEVPAFCRMKYFSDGTSAAMEKEFYEKCPKPKDGKKQMRWYPRDNEDPYHKLRKK